MNQEFNNIIENVRENTARLEAVEFNTEITSIETMEQTPILQSLKDDLFEIMFEVHESLENLSLVLTGNTLQKAEETREQKAVLEKIADKETEVNVEVESSDGILMDLFKLAAVPAAIGVAIASLGTIPGIVSGFVVGLTKALKFDAPLLKTKSIFASIKTGIATFKTAVFDFFKSIGKSFSSKVSSIGSKVKNIFKPITSALDDVSKSFKDVSNMFKGVKPSTLFGGDKIDEMFKILRRVFNPIKNFISTVKAAAPKFLSFGKSIGRLAGRIFLPFTILMSVVDGVKGFIKSFQDSDGESMLGRITDGLFGALGEIVGNLVGIPLDLLKGAVAWIAGKFGLDNVEDALKSFSFKDIIKKLLTGIGDFVQNAVDFVVKMFTDPKEAFGKIASAMGNVKDMILNLHKAILRFILPKPNKNGKWYSPTNLISKAIPASVYNYAGINKATGEIISNKVTSEIATNEVTTSSIIPEAISSTAGADMEATMTDTADNKASTVNSNATNAVSVQDASVNTNNSNNSVTIASPTHTDRTAGLGFSPVMMF